MTLSSHSLVTARRLRFLARKNIHGYAIDRFVAKRFAALPTLGVAGFSVDAAVAHWTRLPTICESPQSQETVREMQGLIRLEEFERETRIHNVLDKIKRTFRVLLRLLGLSFSLAPVLLLYPIFMIAQENHENLKHQDAQDILLWAKEQDQKSDEGTSEWKTKVRRMYFEICLKCAERSGAVVIKLMQWAGSRPDFFGHDFCSVFSRLQDHTTPHSWKHTEMMMKNAFGEDWEERIHLGGILGSGCIGQVYRGTVLTRNSGEERQVAVKVLHPSVKETIDADLDILRSAAYLRKLVEGPSWLDWGEMVEEFARLLKKQLDLRIEGQNLVKFAKNFEDIKEVEFPALVPEFPVDKHVLVETLLDGIPVLEYARQNRDDRVHLNTLCRKAIHSVCKMIFVDNFLHGKSSRVCRISFPLNIYELTVVISIDRRRLTPRERLCRKGRIQVLLI